MAEDMQMDSGRTAPAYEYRSAIGQDSHRLMTAAEQSAQPDRQLHLAGTVMPHETPLAGNSDADVILHALTNAISGISGINILGERADQLCLVEGITASSAYLHEALATLGEWQLCHVSCAIEAKKPRLAGWITVMKGKLAELCGLQPSDIGLTATTGEGLTAFGRGEGISVFCMITVRRKEA